MRLISKYKNFTLLRKILSPCPLKLLRFHRTKWKKTQKVLRYSTFKRHLYLLKKKKFLLKIKLFKNLNFKKLKILKFKSSVGRPKKKIKNFKQKTKNKRKNFFDNSILQVPLKKWFKLKKIYFENLKLKRITSQIFDNSIRNSFFKKELKSRISTSFNKQFCSLFVKPLFKVNVLLTKLFFFTSVYDVNRILQNQEILLNGTTLKQPNVFLKKGDLISFKSYSTVCSKTLVKNLKSSSFFSSFYNFVEIDQYSKTIIVIKDYNSLSNHDISLIYKSYLNMKYLKDYFK